MMRKAQNGFLLRQTEETDPDTGQTLSREYLVGLRPGAGCTEIDQVGSTFKGHSSLKSPNGPNEAIDRLEENWKHGTLRVISTTCAQSAPPSLRR